MGMDVFGRNPSSEKGEYFRANIWSWSPIYELTADLCGDLLDEETIRSMAFNNGAGPEDGLVCATMAHRIEQWLKDHQEGEDDVSLGNADAQGGSLSRLVGDSLAAAFGLAPTYSTDREHLQEWATFLKDCGGFEVW